MSDKLQNYGILFPADAMPLPEEKPDPNGVPIYAKCPANGGLCACTGKCHKIIGYDTDPERYAQYKEDIERRKKLFKEYQNNLGKYKKTVETGITTIEWIRYDQEK